MRATLEAMIQSQKCTSFLSRVLDVPSYGYVRDGVFYKPSAGEIFREFGSRLNVFRSKKNWLPAFGWVMSLSLAVPLVLFFTNYFSWPLALAGFLYSMVLMGSHGTFWLHRYGTHRAFQVNHPIARFFLRNLVIKIIPEEIYIVSHHVHHQYSEKPGDPYNVNGGWLYCFLADANHQMISSTLSREDYRRLGALMSHTSVKVNSYEQYQKYGSLCHPFRTISNYLLNWAFWFGAFYLMGGMPLAIAIFGWAGVWGIGVRTYNYEGHGKGKDRRKVGSDFNREDWSVNQVWPGYVAGEWHNNHHLYPSGSRSGFLSYQLDLPYLLIRFLHSMGVVNSFRDYKTDFMRDHYLPYKNGGGDPPTSRKKLNDAQSVAPELSVAREYLPKDETVA
jgi:fatty-acid desaturase